MTTFLVLFFIIVFLYRFFFFFFFFSLRRMVNVSLIKLNFSFNEVKDTLTGHKGKKELLSKLI